MQPRTDHSPGLQPFTDSRFTARGERRAVVPLRRLETVWFNTGTLCNIACEHCYIESSPRNARLAYLTEGDVVPFLDEIEALPSPVSLIGFTGGEPFMNPEFGGILEETLRRGFETLTLTNALTPFEHKRAALLRLSQQYGAKMRVRVSLDDYRERVHDAERGEGTFARALAAIVWLWRSHVPLEIAARSLGGEPEDEGRRGFAELFGRHDIGVDCHDERALLFLPEMKPGASPPEITEACWGILGKSPGDVMCASSRMVVKRKGAASPAVVACTLLPYDRRFELGATLAQASRPVPLAHPYCASFCVLGGGSCGSSRHADDSMEA